MLLPTQDKEAILTDKEIKEILNKIWHPKKYQRDDGSIDWSKDNYGYFDAGKDIAKAQIAKLEKLGYHKGLPTSVEEALNSGDGAYRP